MKGLTKCCQYARESGFKGLHLFRAAAGDADAAVEGSHTRHADEDAMGEKAIDNGAGEGAIAAAINGDEIRG